MSNIQLKWHLLKETNSIVLNKVERRFVFVNHFMEQEPTFPSLDFLGTFFLSGKELAALVRMILSQELDISRKFSKIWVTLCRESFEFLTKPGIIENLALRWTRCLEVKNFQRSPEFLNIVATLNDDNCIETLRLEPNEHLSVDNCVAIVEACPYLSTLICPPDLLVSLLERVKEPALSKLHTIEMTESGYANSSLFEQLKNHPEQCPVLETLTMTLDNNGLKILSELAPDYAFPTITWYNVIMKSNCQPIDFPLIASTWLMFPALKSAFVGVHDQPEYLDTKKIPEVYKSFEKFNPNGKFTYSYILEPEYPCSKTHADELEVQLRALGTITSFSRRHCVEYSVTTSHPNKTLNFTIIIYVDSGDEEAEDFEYDDDAADSEEDSEVEDDDEENSDEGSEVEDNGKDSKDEESDGKPANKHKKLVQ